MANYTIDKIQYNGNTYNIQPGVFYGTCDTPSSVPTKTINCYNFQSFQEGQIINIKFTYENDGQFSQIPLNFNVNNTGVTTVYKDGYAALQSNSICWQVGERLSFIYDGEYFQYIGRTDNVRYNNTTLKSPILTASTAGDRLIISDYNLSSTAVDAVDTSLISKIGNLQVLQTASTNSLVSAINTLHTAIYYPYQGTVTYQSGWGPYDSDDYTVMLRKYGKIVIFSGAFKNTSTVAFTTSNEKHPIATIPEAYRPLYAVTALCQGSGHYIWQIDVNTSGVVNASRFRTSPNTAATASVGCWWPFNLTWSLE